MILDEIQAIVSSLEPADQDYIRNLSKEDLIRLQGTLGQTLQNAFRSHAYPFLFAHCYQQVTPQTRSFDSISGTAIRLIWDYLRKPTDDGYLPSSPFYRFALSLLSAEAGDASVRQLLIKLAPPAAGEQLRIYFPGGRTEPPLAGGTPLSEVLARYDGLFAGYLASSGVRPEQVAEFCVVATRGNKGGGLRYIAETIDYRGRSTGVQVVFVEPVTPAGPPAVASSS